MVDSAVDTVIDTPPVTAADTVAANAVAIMPAAQVSAVAVSAASDGPTSKRDIELEKRDACSVQPAGSYKVTMS